MECPKCRREIKTFLPTDELIFCPYCGERLDYNPAEEFNFCPVCGQKLPPDSIYCLHCGKGLKSSTKSRVVSGSSYHVPAGDYSRSASEESEYRETCNEKPAPAETDEDAGIEYDYEPENVQEPLWIKIRYWFMKLTEPVRDLISGRWRMRRLYRKWEQNGDIAPEDNPSTSDWAHTPAAEEYKSVPRTSLLFIAVCALVFIAFFVIIAIVMSQCG
jgi:predicted nucleic acid-binding Zn ribbon protein